MASLPDKTRMAVVALALVAASCTAGSGTGSASGVVSAPDCGLDAEPYDLRPSFFVIDPTEDFAEIRIQRGSDFEDRSDAITIFVPNAPDVKTTRLGEPLPVSLFAEDGARMNVALNDTCPFDLEDQPVNYVGISGTITFTALYVPEVDSSDLETTGSFEDVLFVDPSDPEDRWARLSGDFTFLFSRGRPAQRFP